MRSPAEDACGENGEFHTFVYDGPMFRKAIPIECGEIVTGEGFVFADVSEATLPSQPGCTMPSAWELKMEIPADNVSSGRDWGRRLLLDYVAYSMGYTAARQRMPRKKVKPYEFNYEGWERGSLIAKHVFGCISLLTLIAVLAVTLLGSVVHAQTASDMEVFKGHWCGSDKDGNNYMVLDIRFDSNKVSAMWSTHKKSDEPCSVESATQKELRLWCGNHIFISSEPRNYPKSLLARWEELPPTASGMNTLRDCQH
jgi:Diphthamide synthase